MTFIILLQSSFPPARAYASDLPGFPLVASVLCWPRAPGLARKMRQSQPESTRPPAWFAPCVRRPI